MRTPVAHFPVRGFASDGINEVMAHIAAVGAALGTREDGYEAKGTTNPAPKTTTGRVCSRITAMLSDAEAALTYKYLFEFRSAFGHGRGGLHPVSTVQRVAARRLARRVAAALAELGGTGPYRAGGAGGRARPRKRGIHGGRRGQDTSDVRDLGCARG